MSISVVCTSCGKKYRLKDELEGKKFRCKACEQVLVVTESPQPMTTKQTKSAGQSQKRKPKSPDDQPAAKRTRRKKKPIADPYAHGDELFGSALDRFDGNYGEDFPEDDNPYRAPTHQGSASRRRQSTSSEPLTLVQKCFSLKGRINRNTYWTISLVMNFGFQGLGYILESLDAPLFAFITLLLLLLPSLWITLALQVKRWHDRDKSGLWFFISFIPIFGWIWTFVECGCLAGTAGDNDYGSEPE